MKGITSKLIAIVLSLTLVFTMSGVAFADTGVSVDKAAPAVTNGVADTENVLVDTANAKLVKAESNKTAVKSWVADPLTVKTIATSATALPEYDTWEMDPYTAAVATITATTTGYVWLDASVTADNPNDWVRLYLCESFDMETGEYMYYDGGYADVPADYDAEDVLGIYLKKGQTIYLYMETPDDNSGQILVDVRGKMYNSTQRTLPVYANANQYMLSSGFNKTATGTSDLYYKVVPNKTGLMTVNLNTYPDNSAIPTYGQITLYNAAKTKKLSNSIIYSSEAARTKAYFGVTKGQTYYIRVQTCIDGNGYYYPKYGVKYNVTAYTDRNINTTAKAKKLTKGAAVTRTLFKATNATGVDYYKIYVPKTQAAKFVVNVQNMRGTPGSYNANLKIQVYKNGKQVGTTKTLYMDTKSGRNLSGTYTVTYGSQTGKATKGTYYIKITKSIKASGQYSIRYK